MPIVIPERFSGRPANAVEFVLPSKGIPYIDVNRTPLLPGGVVLIRPMEGEEEIILNSGSLSSHAMASKIIQACTIFPKTTEKGGIRQADILMTDRVVLLCAIRAISFGVEYVLEAKCQSCNRSFTHKIDLRAGGRDGLQIEEMPREVRDKNTGLVTGTLVYDPIEGIPCELPVSKRKVRLRLLTESDEAFLIEQTKLGPASKFVPKFILTKNLDPSKFIRTLLTVKAWPDNPEEDPIPVIHSDPARLIALANNLARLPIRDYQFLGHVYAKWDVLISPSYEVDCPSCEEKVGVPFALNTEFFHPAFD